MEHIILPSGIDTIQDEAFSFCNKVKSITVYCNIPPYIGGNETFYGINKNIPVNVPAGSLLRYKRAAYWKEFFNITYGIVGINEAEYNTEILKVQNGYIIIPSQHVAHIYDITGRLISVASYRFYVPVSGIYIVQIDNMPAQKIYVRL